VTQSLAALTTPLSKAQWTAQLLLALQGLGIVTPTGLGGGSSPLGTGSLSLSGTPVSTLSSPTAVGITIVTAGEQGAAQFTYSIAGAVSATTTVPASPGVFLMPGTGVSLTFNSGASGSGTSFAVGDTFSFALNPSVLPTTSWQSGGAFRTIVEIEAQALADLSALVAAIAASGLTTTSTGSWLDLLANNFYALTRNQATFTAGTMNLAAAVGAGPYSVTTGSMFVADPAGHLFTNTTSGTVPQGCAAWAAGTFTLNTRVTNGINIYICTQTGTSVTGPTGTGTNFADGGTALWSWQSTSYLQLVWQAALSGSAYNVGNNAVTTITAGTLPGVTVSNPDPGSGTWITSAGANIETDSALAVRCQARWPALSQSAGTAAVYTLWALSAEQAAGLGTTITRTLVQPDPSIAGRVQVYLATATGAAGSGAVTAANNYIQARIPLVSTANVQAASAIAQTVTGTVNYFSTKTTLAVVQAAVQTALAAYIAGVALGSDAVGTVKVYWSEVESVCGTVFGMRNVNMLLNGGTSDSALTTGQVATLTLGSITYNGVTA
jgi:hypothetical protein